MFRLIEASEGDIYIDGIEVSTLGLYDLRSRLTILPQVRTNYLIKHLYLCFITVIKYGKDFVYCVFKALEKSGIVICFQVSFSIFN